MSAATRMKAIVQRMLRMGGWEIRRYKLEELGQLRQMLDIMRVDTVLDVGANVGQFAEELRNAGFRGKIVSFEPQAAAYEKLTAKAAHDPLWEVAPRSAVGAALGEISINISENSVSSSMLPILEAHTDSAPTSRYIGSEVVPVVTLDDSPAVPNEGRIFLKIDTQGFEHHVLNGAAELLMRVVGVQTELSLAPLYEGQADFLAIFDRMRQAGLQTWSINPGFLSRDTGRMLQVDATFFRE